jgi:Tol biopolymer transport system component
MNARTKAVTIWSAVCGVALLAGLLAFTERTAETLMTNSYPPVELESVSFKGTPPNGNSSGAVASGDGRCVAYYSDATDILPPGPDGDNNTFTDVFLFDRDTQQTTRVSVGFNGEPPNGPSQAQRFRPSIDDGCTCVAFSSDATNLVPDDTNGKTDVFVRGLAAGTTALVSVGLGDAPANGPSSFTSVSGDCQKVAFQSLASNLVPDDTNNVADVFVYDFSSGTTTRVSVGPGGVQGNGPSITPSISADGRCVAFASAATNLLPSSPDTNKTLDIYVECDGVVTCRASVNSDGQEANDMSFLPALNADGTIVAFKSNATNLVADDFNQVADVFVHNCVTGETVRASVGDEGQEGNDIAIPPSISGDARFVAFGSFASNLLLGVNTGGNSQVYVRDLVNNTTTLVSSNRKGQPGNGGVPDLPPSISLDGGWVAFDDQATDLIVGNTQGFVNAYIRANVTVAPSPTPTNTGPPTATPTPKIPCALNTDCPVGFVCGPGGFCEPAPTPTPTIACTDTSQCPSGLTCVNGVCRDLSTPTATPTPLPTCTVDADCPDPNDFCRAGVCVPKRPCQTQAMCRGDRETCLAGDCECGGDCNLDGVVFGSEITTMVLIESGIDPLSACPAGDINQDGAVTPADVTLAVYNLGLGCPGEGSPLIVAADRTDETRTLEVGNITGIPGESVNFDINLSGGDQVTTAQVDILYPQALLQISTTEPACTLDPRITAISTDFLGVSELPQVPMNPPGEGRLRVAVVDTGMPIRSFDSGPLFHCHLRIQPGAAPGSSELTFVMEVHTPEIADPTGSKFNAQVTGGAITINPPTPCTADTACSDSNPCPSGLDCVSGVCQCPADTECKGGVCKPIIQCMGPDDCLGGRQACVNNLCQCGGDCNNDGIVRSNEISTMIAIINGQVPLAQCLAADVSGDGIVRSNEISIAIFNINNGCP